MTCIWSQLHRRLQHDEQMATPVSAPAWLSRFHDSGDEYVQSLAIYAHIQTPEMLTVIVHILEYVRIYRLQNCSQKLHLVHS